MKTRTILTALSLTALFVGGATASQEQLAKSIFEARLETARTSAQLKVTLESLTALTKQSKGDLRPAYSNYCAEVTRTEDAAKVTHTRVTWMAGDGRNYFKGWQETVNAYA